MGHPFEIALTRYAARAYDQSMRAASGGDSMIRWFAAIAAFAAMETAQAESLYKCVGPRDKVAIQSSPCPSGTRTEWVRGYVPDRTPQRPRRYSAPPRQDRNHNPGPASRVPSDRDLRVARCEAARAKEADFRRRRPHPTYDELRGWNKYTYEACKDI